MMEIQGLQKLTLLDYPGKVACTLFTGGCNFRCPFCHNKELVVGMPQPALDLEEVMGFLHKRAGLLDGVCITGGEPLLHAELGELLNAIRQLGYSIKLDTNGSRPQFLKTLVAAGLVDYVAMDIKNAPDKYGQTIGLSNFDLGPIEESVQFLLSAAVDYEFRTTVVKELHQASDFVQIGQWIKGAKRYFLQGFIDSGSLLTEGLHGCTATEMQGFQAVLQPLVPQTALRGVDNI